MIVSENELETIVDWGAGAFYSNAARVSDNAGTTTGVAF